MRSLHVFMLYLAAIILLGHNFLPHHHYKLSAKENSLNQSESKHSHNGTSHHHHGNDEPKQDNSSSKDPLNHPLHQEAVDTFILKQTANLQECLSAAVIPQELYLNFPLVTCLVPLHYKPDKLLFRINFYYSCFLLRGPPAFQLS